MKYFWNTLLLSKCFFFLSWNWCCRQKQFFDWFFLDFENFSNHCEQMVRVELTENVSKIITGSARTMQRNKKCFFFIQTFNSTTFEGTRGCRNVSNISQKYHSKKLKLRKYFRKWYNTKLKVCKHFLCRKNLWFLIICCLCN